MTQAWSIVRIFRARSSQTCRTYEGKLTHSAAKFFLGDLCEPTDNSDLALALLGLEELLLLSEARQVLVCVEARVLRNAFVVLLRRQERQCLE